VAFLLCQVQRCSSCGFATLDTPIRVGPGPNQKLYGVGTAPPRGGHQRGGTADCRPVDGKPVLEQKLDRFLIARTGGFHEGVIAKLVCLVQIGTGTIERVKSFPRAETRHGHHDRLTVSGGKRRVGTGFQK